PFGDGSIGRERMRSPGLAESAHQRRAVGLEEDESRLHSGGRLQFAIHLRKLLEEPAFTHVDDNRDALETCIAAAGQIRERRNELAGQVIDAKIAQVLERSNGVRLSRPGQPRENDEPVCRARSQLRLVSRLHESSPGSPSSSATASASAARSCCSSRVARSRAALSPRDRSNWFRAATSTRMARFRPGATGMRIRGILTVNNSKTFSSRPSRSYSRSGSQRSNLTTSSTRFDVRVDATPNRSRMLITPRPRTSM